MSPVGPPIATGRIDDPADQVCASSQDSLLGRGEWVDGLRQGVLIGAAILTLVLPPTQVSLQSDIGTGFSASAVPVVPQGPRFADFARETASSDARRLANWIASSDDHKGQFFVLVDKKDAKVFLFNADGVLIAATPVLIGAARGDDSVAGIGAKAIAEVQPHERTTPAGRFAAEIGRNVSGEDVVWVDYGAAVSMHRVRANEPSERRLERLKSPTVEDNRISYGCINVPVDFYENVIQPAFRTAPGVVYVLPEVKDLHTVFPGIYDVEARHAKVLAAARE